VVAPRFSRFRSAIRSFVVSFPVRRHLRGSDCPLPQREADSRCRCGLGTDAQRRPHRHRDRHPRATISRSRAYRRRSRGTTRERVTFHGCVATDRGAGHRHRHHPGRQPGSTAGCRRPDSRRREATPTTAHQHDRHLPTVRNRARCGTSPRRASTCAGSSTPPVTSAPTRGSRRDRRWGATVDRRRHRHVPRSEGAATVAALKLREHELRRSDEIANARN
jgi:hypothetical protein